MFLVISGTNLSKNVINISLCLSFSIGCSPNKLARFNTMRHNVTLSEPNLKRVLAVLAKKPHLVQFEV